MAPEVVEIHEWDSWRVERSTPIESDIALANFLSNQGQGSLVVRWLQDGSAEVASRSWIGVARFSDFEVHVLPKLAGGNLATLEMLDYVAGIDSTRRLPAAHRLEAEGLALVDLVCWLVAEEAERILRHGLLSDYVIHEDTLGMIRGRLLLDEQIRRRYGQLQVLDCRFDEYEAAIIENHVLATALRAAKRLCRNQRIRQLLARTEPLFTEICPTDLADPVDARRAIIYNRRNSHYRAAHYWAFLLLSSRAIHDLYGTTGPASFAFMIDMNDLFERFLAQVLQSAFARTDAEVDIQARTTRVIVDEYGRNYSTLIPDVLLRRRWLLSRALPVDTKYKLYDDRKVDPGDLYQLFLYAYAFAAEDTAPIAALLYPTPGAGRSFQLELRSQRGKVGGALRVIGVNLPQMLSRIRLGASPATDLTAELLAMMTPKDQLSFVAS